MRSNQEKINNKRNILWLKILKIDPVFSSGEFVLFQQQAQVELLKSTAETIEVDVSRSFYNMGNEYVSGKNLTKILNTYAIVNKRLDYCQGMNFIAGVLFMFFKDESQAFAVMREIIRRNEMATLFNTELPML